ncbi:septal ring lytic transglycosylase RlpA family protein [Terasakiella sp. A23]|uniref:septal ring lytic transglycosylase RlpA family protein n=1 Tax=Terasakiella sp. FCG-A23 TaxID=3080561 RepID=UPI002955D46B|nr:septal ring lytic transglycosylase RlpA family protein [Terasakiella sp. A23]MDV7338585.1 septal ring lytic transglycosylase RlpA family protein [Terasakiella sp. A23]
MDIQQYAVADFKPKGWKKGSFMMKRFLKPAHLAMGLMASVFLSGCAETTFLSSSIKSAGSDKPVAGHYKVGNPYQIQGVWYYPAEDFDYVETGISSWYGPQFHGKPTANGEVFDMNLVSAAHRTLPLPSLVRVTNLENGRSLVVRVNDRGPFAHGRILDMSKRGAQLLGFEKQGTARVKVEILKDQSLAIKNSYVNQIASKDSPIKSTGMAKPQVSAQSLDVPQGAQAAPQPQQQMTMADKPVAQSAIREPEVVKPTETVKTYAVSATRMYIQAGAFSKYENANRVKAKLSSVGDVQVSQVLVNGRDFFRVRVGPLQSVGQADQILNDVIQAGYPSAKIIIEKGKG